jgi:pyruvate/2-oxoacid:ferredoxin oxidoreductase beta subunit
MKHLTLLAGLAFVLALAGCNIKQKMEKEAEKAAEEMVKAAEEEAAKTVEATEEKEEEAAPEEEVAAEEGPEMAVAKEDIDKAIEIYKVLHDEDLTADAKKRKFDELLSAAEWQEDEYKEMIYQITQDPPSRVYYNEGIEADD